ncbi:hypothetical protein TruAng_005785 [Truncatella angustata]|nr:hypothetical protein TruAng_005785 [Truncatella angustata]
MSFLRRFFASSATPEVMASAKEKAQKIIDDNAVDAKFYAIELDQVPDGAEIQSALLDISGQRTVPNVFIGQKHIGGNSDLQAKSGELPQLLKSVGAL